MAGSVTNFIYQSLRVNDGITDLLIHIQTDGKKFYIRAFCAALQILTSTVSLVVTSAFALLSAFAGVICKGVGASQIGEDLLQSAAVAFLGNRPSAQKKFVTGAVSHLLLLSFSVVNLATVGLLPVCFKVAVACTVIGLLAKTEP